MKEKRIRAMTENRSAKHDYFIVETLECGMVLDSSAVKSFRSYNGSINGAYVFIDNGNLVLRGASLNGHHSLVGYNKELSKNRDIRLLAHRNEIDKLERQVEQKGFTIIPLKVYASSGKIKCLIALCKGKHEYDKRATIKERDSKRQIDRALKVSQMKG